jgi:hypothetical protein
MFYLKKVWVNWEKNNSPKISKFTQKPNKTLVDTRHNSLNHRLG